MGLSNLSGYVTSNTRFETLQNFFSLSMKLTTLLNERQRRLAKWNDKVSPIAEWLSEKEELVSSPLSDSLDHDAARTHKNEFVVRTEREMVILNVFICALCYN